MKTSLTCASVTISVRVSLMRSLLRSSSFHQYVVSNEYGSAIAAGVKGPRRILCVEFLGGFPRENSRGVQLVNAQLVKTSSSQLVIQYIKFSPSVGSRPERSLAYQSVATRGDTSSGGHGADLNWHGQGIG